jgi:prepilin-type N-terminal cleavage/methylation domain-containing protein
VPFLHDERGFSLLEIIVVCAIIAVLGGIAVGVTTTMVRVEKADAGVMQLDSFLKRYREMAVARRRDIEIRFLSPNRVQAAVRAVPDPPTPTPAPTLVETMTFEGRVEYRRTPGVPDTPNGFGNAVAVSLGGVEPVMFSSEGAFIDIGSNPVNATISLGVEGDDLSATAITILGATARIERWRWSGGDWVK